MPLNRIRKRDDKWEEWMRRRQIDQNNISRSRQERLDHLFKEMDERRLIHTYTNILDTPILKKKELPLLEYFFIGLSIIFLFTAIFVATTREEKIEEKPAIEQTEDQKWSNDDDW